MINLNEMNIVIYFFRNQIKPYSVIVVITNGHDINSVLEGIQNQRILVISSDGAYQPVLSKLYFNLLLLIFVTIF